MQILMVNAREDGWAIVILKMLPDISHRSNYFNQKLPVPSFLNAEPSSADQSQSGARYSDSQSSIMLSLLDTHQALKTIQNGKYT